MYQRHVDDNIYSAISNNVYHVYKISVFQSHDIIQIFVNTYCNLTSKFHKLTLLTLIMLARSSQLREEASRRIFCRLLRTRGWRGGRMDLDLKPSIHPFQAILDTESMARSIILRLCARVKFSALSADINSITADRACWST